VRPPSVQLYERRFETPPSQQGQVDFADFEVEFTAALKSRWPGAQQVVA
jgi:transposase